MSCPALPEEIWKRILQHLSVAERLSACSTVSTVLYRAAAAATQEIYLPWSRPQFQCIRRWLEQHGHHVTKLQVDLQGPNSTAWTQLPCQQLQELKMSRGSLQLAPSSSQPGLLQCCTGLTKLFLYYVKVLDGAAGLAALSRLPRLQDLQLHAGHGTELLIPDTVLGLLTELTRLARFGPFDTTFLKPLSSLCALQELSICSSSVALVPEEVPRITQLTSLRTFTFIRYGTLDPALLYSCTNLQHLALDRVSIRAGSNPNALLELLGRLHELQHLEVLQVTYDWPPASAAYGTLVGSSKLQHLVLWNCSLPAGVWQFVFPAGCHRPQLTHLSVGWLPQAATLSAGNVRSLANCCPALQDLLMELQPGVQLPNNLSSLSSLTSLNVSQFSPGAFLSSLVTLQCLESLSTLYAVCGGSLPPEDLLRLTCLRQLTSLSLTYGDAAAMEDLDLDQQDLESAPDVWLQVLGHCASFPACQPEAIRSLSQQLAKEQQQRLETNALLQQQLDAANAEAAELRGRLAAVEGQVQQLLACLPQFG